mmetsp:Transcript_2659/g.3673  ORF Transcript_2659/g.3673 Transcript_2659/m.3673 type:complete len:203 (+) Transcript_2659:110-718(+)
MIDTRPIVEAWGNSASIDSCFFNSKQMGSALGSTRRSDISHLVDTKKMTFHHYISSIRVCELPEQTSDSLIQSVHFYLGINGDEDDIELDVIGFDYGRCTKKPITGAIREIGTLLVDGRAVHRFWIETENESYSWGPEATKSDIDRMTQKTIRFDDPKVRPMGFYGSWKFKGLTSLGVVEFTEDCIPKDGVYTEPGAKDVEI